MDNLGPDHERRLREFLEGLRSDPTWTEAQIRAIEDSIRAALDAGGRDGNGTG